jgi:membrane-associated phospholipid phosphatase
VVAFYIIYDSSRGLVGGGRSAALSHAQLVMSWERATSMTLERGIQAVVGGVPVLMRLFGWGYMGLHLGATGAALLWLHRRRASEAYVKLRTALLMASGVGLIGFVLFPTAPPRLAVLGVADSVSHGAVNLNASALRWLYNPYAAMPSMHMAYATLVGYSLARWGRRRWLRWLGGLYPLWVAVEVIATGNHFVLDVLGGVLVATGALMAANAFVSRRALTPTPDTFEAQLGNRISVADVTDIGGSGLDNQVELLNLGQAPLRRVMDTTGGSHEIIDFNLESID